MRDACSRPLTPDEAKLVPTPYSPSSATTNRLSWLGFTNPTVFFFGEGEVSAFVSHLAVRGVSASTQNQALSAVLFLYEVVFGRRLAWMDQIVRAQRPARLPVVLSRAEVVALLGRLRGTPWLMASPCTGAVCGCSNARNCASKTSTSTGAS